MEMNRNGLTLMEESFCQLVALGKTGVEAYSEAFSKPLIPGDDKTKRKLTKKASYLAKRPDVAARIVEAKGEQKRRDRELWEQRGNRIADALYGAIEKAMTSEIKDPKTHDSKPAILDKDTLKGIEVLAKMKGLNAPEENVIRNGGMAEDAVPRGLAAVSDEDLDKIIEQGEVIDVGDETEEKNNSDIESEVRDGK